MRWRWSTREDIVNSKPADFFSAGNLPLLAIYCRLVAETERVLKVVEAGRPGEMAHDRDTATASKLGNLALSIAVKLRLTQQQTMRIENAKLREQVKPTELVGGFKAWNAYPDKSFFKGLRN